MTFSGVPKGVATANGTLPSGLTGNRHKWNSPGSKYRVGRQESGGAWVMVRGYQLTV